MLHNKAKPFLHKAKIWHVKKYPEQQSRVAELKNSKGPRIESNSSTVFEHYVH